MINNFDVKKLIDEGVIEHHPDVNLVNQTLLNLVNAGLLNKEDKERYVFKEQVTWEVVYQTLLYSERRYLHDIVASHIEKNKENEIESYAARLVYHYQKSENKKKIIFYSALAGDYAYSLFAIDDALSFYDESLKNINEIKCSTSIDKSMLLEKKADVIESTGLYLEAIDTYNESLEILSKEENSKKSYLPWNPNTKRRKPVLYHKLSVAYERSVQYEKSIEFLDLADDSLPQRPGDIPVKIYATRSVVYYRKYEYDKALGYAKKSLSLSIKRKSLKDISYAYNVIANIHSSLGEVDQSITYFDKALSSYQKTNDMVGMSMCYYNLGTSYSIFPDFDKSNEYFFKSIDVNTKMHNYMSVMQDHIMIGNNKLQVKDLDEALAFLYKSIDLYSENMGREDIYGICLSRISEAYIYKDELDKAREYIKKSLGILTKLEEMPDSLAQSKIVLVELLLKENKPDDAVELCNDLVKQFHEMQIANLEIHVMKQLARAYIENNNYKKSYEVLKDAHDLSNNIDSPYDLHSIELLQLKIIILKNMHDSNTIERIQYLSEKLSKYQIWQDLELADDLIIKLNKK